ncbi:MAG: hypothetical protein V3U43_07570 [Pseudomonadales bacterium]
MNTPVQNPTRQSVFQIDIERCPHCGAILRIIACIDASTQEVILRQ